MINTYNLVAQALKVEFRGVGLVGLLSPQICIGITLGKESNACGEMEFSANSPSDSHLVKAGNVFFTACFEHIMVTEEEIEAASLAKKK